MPARSSSLPRPGGGQILRKNHLQREDFKKLSKLAGIDSVGWRYDPILMDRDHTVEWHIAEFEKMAACLSGYTKTCVIRFIDIYQKVARNFPEARTVLKKDRLINRKNR